MKVMLEGKASKIINSIIIFESQIFSFFNGAHGKVRKIHKTESQLSHSAAVNEL